LQQEYEELVEQRRRWLGRAAACAMKTTLLTNPVKYI
jgi:hypothetical protein